MKIQRIIENLEKVFSVILVLFTIAMFVIVFFNVFMRFIMNNSIGWADELSRFIFVWISFLGAVLAYKADEHVGLSFIVDKIKSFRVKKIIMIIQNLIALTVLFILTFYGYKVSIMAKNVSSALSIPMSTLYIIVPFSALIMCVLCFKKIFILINNTATGTIEIESKE